MNLIITCLSIFATFFATEQPELTINVQNIKSFEGEIIIGIFNTEEKFLKDGAAIKNYSIAIDSTTQTIVINDLPKGEYAVSLYHDENSDKECNLNFLGIPKEAYGFSNNIKPKLSAPSFKDCKFMLVEDKVLNIILRH